MAPNIRVPANFGIKHLNSPGHGNLILKLKDGEEMRINSMIMSLNSPVIENLTTDLAQKSLEMDDFTRPAVACFVEAMYTGEVDILEKDIFEDVNKMAHVFDVSWLTKRCLKFYKSDIMNFEDDSYEDILFACEIASRAHYHLNQTKLVNCFVKTIAARGVDKGIFVTRYLAGFACIPKRKIDMALMIARDNLETISNCLMSYLSLTLAYKSFDTNSLYMLQKLNTQDFRNNFPTQFTQLTSFLADFSIGTDSVVAETIENFVKVNVVDGSTESQKEMGISVKTMDLDDAYDEDFKSTAINTDDLLLGWIKPNSSSYDLLPNDSFSVNIKTIGWEYGKNFRLDFTLKTVGGSEYRAFFIMVCQGLDVWRYYLSYEGCSNAPNYPLWAQLNKVPSVEIKHWAITKTTGFLDVVCNGATLLKFNFSTDLYNDRSRTYWKKNCVAVKFTTTFKDSLLLKRW